MKQPNPKKYVHSKTGTPLGTKAGTPGQPNDILTSIDRKTRYRVTNTGALRRIAKDLQTNDTV